MIEKALTEAGWKKFADGRGLQDAALRKALAALAKADKGGAEAQRKALDEIDKQAEALQKAHKADKTLAAQLADVDKASRTQRKAVEEEARAAAKAAAEAEEDEGEEETPALLTSKMKPLLKQVQKGDTVHALIALAGKDLAVLLAKKSISPARRKLLTDHLGVTGGVKFVVGQCLFEDKAHTFVVQTQAAGLAKRLKAALYEQTEMRVKVRVRGLDPEDVDDDGDDETPDEDESNAKAEAGRKAPAQPLDEAAGLQAEYARVKLALYAKLSATVREGGPHKDLIINLMGKAMKAERAADWQEALAIYGQLEDLVGPPDAPAEDAEPEEPGEDDLQERYEALLAELEPLLAAALKAQQGDVSRMRATSQFAREKARSGDFEAALKSLHTLARLLGVDSGEASAPDPGKAFNARLAALLPRIQKAIAAGGEAGKEARLKASEAGVFARKKDFAAAGALLDALEALLAGAEPAAEEEPEGDDDFDVADFRRRWAPVKQGWQDALDTVDGQIGKLQSILKGSDDAELREIADSGLASLTGGLRAPLTAALLDIERSGDAERLKKAIRKADLIAGDFDRHLRASDAVRVTDDNGFGVAVTIRGSLGGALRRMQNLLASVT